MRRFKDVRNSAKRKSLKLAAMCLAAGLAGAVGMDAAGVLPMAYVQADTDGQEDDGLNVTKESEDGLWSYMLDRREGDIIEADLVSYNGTDLYVTIPEKFEDYPVTRISENAFEKVKNTIVDVTIPDGVEWIEDNAFQDCTKLAYVKMPMTLQEIGNNAFQGCVSIPYIKVKTEYGPKGDAGKGILLPEADDLSIEIGTSAFKGCTGLEAVVLSDSVKSFGNYVFDGCTKLKYAYMPKRINSIGDYGIFSECISLETVILPENIDRIDGFDGCSSLESIVIPNGATQIGFDCFKGCTMLESIVIPSSVIDIKADALRDAKKATAYVEPETTAYYHVKNINNFDGKIVLVKSATAKVYTDDKGFKYMVHDAGDCSWAEIVGYVGDSVELEVPGAYYKKGEFEIPELTYNVKYIAGRSFMNKAITALTLPSSIEEIGEDAFSGCSKLESAVIDSNLDIIGDGAFKDCTSLTSIVFPFAITKIGNNAFSGCTSLTEATFATRDYSYTPTLEIGYNAFADCDLRSITLPRGITDISESMFENNTRLASVNIPDSVTYIGDNAFYFCNELASVTIPDKVTYIGDWAFASCLKIKEIRIPIYNTISIGANAFNNCQSLEKAFIYKNAEKIANSAFKNCDKLTIYTQSACAAVTFAENNNIPYVLVDNAKPAEPTTPEPATPAPNDNQSPQGGNGQQTNAGNTGASDSGTATDTTKVVVPTVAKVSGFKAARKKGTNIKCTWKKVKGAAGYQLQYSKSKKFKGFSLMKLSKKKKAMTISKLKKGTTYYVRIRAYKTYKDESGKTMRVYGKWATKTVK